MIDGDDVWSPRKLELQVAAFDRDPAIGISYTSYVEIGAQGAYCLRRYSRIFGRPA